MTPFHILPLDRPRMADAISVWNAALGFFFPMNQKLFEQNVFDDPNYRHGDGLLAIADGQPIGFGLAKRVRGAEAALPAFAGRGHIAALAIVPPYQGRGVGTRLLEVLEQRLKTEGVSEVTAGGGFLHFLPGPPVELKRQLAFWARRGYTLGPEVYDLRRSLVDYCSPERAQQAWESWPRPLQASSIAPEEQEPLLDFIMREFGAGWWYSARHFLRRRAGGETIIVLRESGEIAGFCQVYPPDSVFIGPSIYWSALLEQPSGGLGPLGIARRLRGHGLGLAFLDRCLLFLRERGVRDCVIDWTDLLGFYGKAGFHPWKAYLLGSKRL